jgi:hypothetical protein
MGPLSALSFAAAVVQFVGFGIEVIHKANEIQHSVQEASPKHTPGTIEMARFFQAHLLILLAKRADTSGFAIFISENTQSKS